MSDLKPEELRAMLRATMMLQANMENWKYVAANAEYLDKMLVADALGQILSTMSPLITAMQSHLEIEALTTLDPTDLL